VFDIPCKKFRLGISQNLIRMGTGMAAPPPQGSRRSGPDRCIQAGVCSHGIFCGIVSNKHFKTNNHTCTARGLAVWGVGIFHLPQRPGDSCVHDLHTSTPQPGRTPRRTFDHPAHPTPPPGHPTPPPPPSRQATVGSGPRGRGGSWRRPAAGSRPGPSSTPPGPGCTAGPSTGNPALLPAADMIKKVS